MPGEHVHRTNIMSNFDIRLRILESMEELLQTTQIDKLSVEQIAKQAGLSHSTFYRYFKDKYAPAQWYADYAYMLGADKIGRTCSWQKGYYITEMTILEHLQFFREIAKSNDYNAIDNYCIRTRRETLIETLTHYHHRELTEQLKFQIEATLLLESHLIPRWHYGEFNISLDMLTRWLADLIPHELFEILNTPVTNQDTHALTAIPSIHQSFIQ